MTLPTPATSLASRARRVLGGLALVAGLGLAALLLVPSLLGYQRYVITGQSMTGTIDRGSLVFDEIVPVEDLKVGDIITFEPPKPLGPNRLVTHRIVWRGEAPDGRLGFRTKGDNNPNEDPDPFVLREAQQARVAFHVPYLGYGLAFAADRRNRMILIGLPALILAVAILANMWREAGVEAAAQKAAETAS